MIHSDNSCIRYISYTDMSKLYIGLLWKSRKAPRVRAIIKGHVRLIRKWEAA